MTDESVLLLGVGDIHFERPDGESIFRHVQPYFDKADILYANSEQMYAAKATAAREHPTYSHPRGGEIVAKVGFDVVSFANNHTLDWGPQGLLDTVEATRKAGVHPLGAGATISEARLPVILERKGVRIGFLGYCCTGPNHYAATESSVGYAPVHATTRYEQVDYQPGTPPKIHSEPLPEHLAQMERDIADLAQKVDAVVISIHWGLHFVPAVVPDYCRTVGHAAVRAGAALILGTHAHMLKGVEVFEGVPIFYSTGNFAMEMGAKPGNMAGLSDTMQWLSRHYRFTVDPNYPLTPGHPDGKYTLMVEADFTKSGLQACRVIPCLVNRDAEPEPALQGSRGAETVMAYMERVTAEEGLNAVFERVDEARLAIRAGAPAAGDNDRQKHVHLFR